MDMDLVRKWARDNYPFLASNDDAIVALYKTRVLKEHVTEKTNFSYKYSPIKQLEEGVPAMIIVTKIDKVRDVVKDVCAVCLKSNCTEHTERMTKYGGAYNVLDMTGSIRVFLFGDKLDKDTLDMNDNFIMYGNKKTNQKFGDITFYLKSLKAVTTSQMSALYAVIDYLTLHSSNGTLPETEYDNFVNMSPC